MYSYNGDEDALELEYIFSFVGPLVVIKSVILEYMIARLMA